VYDQKPWLKNYEPHVPPTLEYPETPIPVILREKAAQYPDHPIIIFKGRTIRFGDFDQMVDRFAVALQGLGVQRGDRVAIHLPNCPQFPIAYYAVLRLGAMVVPCNPTYTARELTHQLTDSGSKVIVTLSLMYPLVKQIRAQTPLEHVIVAQIKDYFPPLLSILFTLLREKKSGHRANITGDPQTYWFVELLESAQGQPEPVELGMEDTAVLMYTGGTTGVSKGAQLSHRNIIVNPVQGQAWLKAEDRQARVLTALPLFHSYGMTTCLNFAALMTGTMILVPDPRDVTDIIKTISKYRPNLYPGVPALYNAINHYPGIEKYDLNSVEVCTSGAAPLPPEVQQKFQSITGANLAEGYGLSEASPITHSNPVMKGNIIGTVGLPWPDTEAMIVDVELGEEPVPVGEEGELIIRGPQVMSGYWNMPTETANALRHHGEGGPWLHTGDIAVMDEEGYFKIVDRKKDMILGAGGLNVYPREIEDVLYEHPKILEAAAVGVPVPGKGERVKLFIVVKPGETLTEEEVLAFCEENLAPYKRPKAMAFRDSLPKTNVGKVLRRVLLEEELGQQ
jgi:long-chain acyl-CoA synthetase